jgi:6-pyruvoyltetrahydropterin/6-carboxytetrahydropterin synthase
MNANPPIGILTRRETFSASHRLHATHLSDEKNRELFGKCNRENGHGHNYVIEVSVRGSIDPATGLVMNLTDLKHVIAEQVLARVDHRHLNLDVPEF